MSKYNNNCYVCLIKYKGLGVTYGIASPRRANLINGFGKCVNVDPLTHSGLGLQQSNCDPNDKTMLWSWNEVSLGSKDRHICMVTMFFVGGWLSLRGLEVAAFVLIEKIL